MPDFHLLREFLRRPTRVGAITPSSLHLAHEITSSIGLSKAKVVVEFGAGTGPFTGEILRKMDPAASFVCIERSPQLAEVLRRRFPDLDLVEDSVANLKSILDQRGLVAADCVVSGLPWASFGSDLQDRLLQTTLDTLSPDGQFATFAYLHGLLLPAAWAFRRKLRSNFSQVQTSRVVWANLPPAFVCRCTR